MLYLLLLLLSLTLSVFYLHKYIYYIFTSKKDLKIESFIYKLLSINSSDKDDYKIYFKNILSISGVVALLFLILQIFQRYLPGGYQSVNSLMAIQNSIAFITNTDFQSYSDGTIGNLIVSLSIIVNGFVSASIGLIVFIFIADALNRENKKISRNFYVDLIRSIIRLFLPISIITSMMFIVLGTPSSTHDIHGTDLHGNHFTVKNGGYVAAWESIKMLGGNGGGIFSANSAHPYENPTDFTNVIQIFLMLLIPFTLPLVYGKFVKDKKHGYCILSVMLFLFLSTFALFYAFDLHYLNLHKIDGVSLNMEGKESRFGYFWSLLYAHSTTSTSTGATISAHESYSGYGITIMLINMLLGEITPGGIGTGMYSMIFMIIISVFIIGLMVGRTPEYLMKQITSKEIVVSVLFILVVPLLLFLGLDIILLSKGVSYGTSKSGTTGLLEILYNLASVSNNNGSSFGMNSNLPLYQIIFSIIMFLARYIPIYLVLYLADKISSKSNVVSSIGSLSTNNAVFGITLISVILIIIGITYLPILLSSSLLISVF